MTCWVHSTLPEPAAVFGRGQLGQSARLEICDPMGVWPNRWFGVHLTHSGRASLDKMLGHIPKRWSSGHGSIHASLSVAVVQRLRNCCCTYTRTVAAWQRYARRSVAHRTTVLRTARAEHGGEHRQMPTVVEPRPNVSCDLRNFARDWVCDA